MTFSPRRVGALFGASVVLVGLVAGCASSEPTTSAAPEESDNSFTLYAGRDEALIAPLIEQFTADTGIEVEVRYGTSPELSALLIEEGSKTPADVFLSQDAGALGALSAADLLSTLPDDITSRIPAEYTSTDGMWVGVTGRARVIAYDSQALSESEVPDSVDELTDAEWSGRVGFPPGNASFQSFITALRVLEGEDAAEAWVKGISENSPVLTEKNGATLDLVNAGELDLALINHYYWYERASELGEENMRAQLKFLPGDAGGIVNVTGAAILAPASTDPDALEFVRYLITEEAQNYFVENTFEYPLLPGIEAPAGLPSLDDLVVTDFDLSDLSSLVESQQLLAKYGLL